MEIANAINACYNGQRAALGRTYENLGFQKTLGRSSLLHTLFLASRALTHSEIRAELEITQGSVTFLVDGLEKQGLVTRTVDPTDRRVVYVELTDRGKQVCGSITPAVVDLFGRLCRDFTEAEKTQFLDYLFRFLRQAHEMYEEEPSEKATPVTADAAGS
jgi:DNA-binding MarR family transcriptional regulator